MVEVSWEHDRLTVRISEFTNQISKLLKHRDSLREKKNRHYII